MNRYKHHFENHFASCILLAYARDPYRNRDVQLRALPGEFDHVGVSDGTDSWIAPVAGDPMRVGVARILENLRLGIMPKPEKPVQGRRQRAHLIEQPPAPTPRPRRHLLVE